jgi:dipeptidyl aminopeptidase/acylaminoacyl peptidase
MVISRAPLLTLFAVAAMGTVNQAYAGSPILWSETVANEVNGVTDLAFSPDGKHIAIAAWGTTVRICDAESGKVLRSIVCDSVSPTLAVAYSPDGKYLATGTAKVKRDAVKLWDEANGELVRSCEATSYVADLAFSPDGQTLAAADRRDLKLIRVSDAAVAQKLQGHTASIYALAWLPNSGGKTLASGGFDRTVRTWQVEDGNCLMALNIGDAAVESLAFPAQGDRIVTAATADGKLARIDLKTERVVETLGGHTSCMNAVALSPNGNLLVSGGGVYKGNSGEFGVQLWRVRNGLLLRNMNGHGSHAAAVKAVAFSPDGKTFVSGGADGLVVHWGLFPDELDESGGFEGGEVACGSGG